jgi:hypothetical protein
MVFLYEKFGGLSNNLFQHIHINSFCKANNIEFVNLFIEEYEGKKKYPFKYRLLHFFRKPLKALGSITVLDLDSGKDVSFYESEMKRNKTGFVRGWSYRNMTLTEKDRTFYESHFFRGMESLSQIIPKGKTNVAIHIRRGDYDVWEGGRYFYSDEFYGSVIQKMKEELKENYSFIIFTNEPNLNKDHYLKIDKNIIFSQRKEKEDHYLMHCCDYILGPPSSFSMWAAYLGNKKIFLLKEAKANFDLNSFYTFNG